MRSINKKSTWVVATFVWAEKNLIRAFPLSPAKEPHNPAFSIFKKGDLGQEINSSVTECWSLICDSYLDIFLRLVCLDRKTLGVRSEMNHNEENRQKHFRSHRRRRRHRRRRCRCCSRRRRRRFTSTASSFSTSSSSSSSVHHLFTADVFQPHSSSFGFCCSSPPTIAKKLIEGSRWNKSRWNKKAEKVSTAKKSFSWNKFRNETSFWIFYSFEGCNFFPLRLIYGAEDQVCLQLWCPLSPPTQAPPRPVPALLL